MKFKIANDGNKTDAVMSYQQELAEILKLDTDCFIEICKYLSLKDLISVGQTCKTLNQKVYYVLKQHFSGANMRFLNNRTEISDSSSVGYSSGHFNKLIEKLQIYNGSLEKFIHIRSRFAQLLQIDFRFVQITRTQIKKFQQILNKIEILTLYETDIDGDMHDDILRFTPNLKKLTVICRDKRSLLVGNGNKWLHQKYPTMQQFECENDGNEQFKIFLELNPNIKYLTVTDKYIRNYGLSLIQSDIKFNELSVFIKSNVKKIYHHLEALHEHGFYNELKIYFFTTEISESDMRQLEKLNGLVKLFISGWFGGNIKLCNMPNLKELVIHTEDQISNFLTLPSAIPNLEIFLIGNSSSNSIWTLCKQLKKLKKIRINSLGNGIYFNIDNFIINLRALNRERMKLDGAKKLTLYFKENIYLATKWSLNETNWNSIQLKRESAWQRNHAFCNDF